jgi:hypothetical protein
VLLAGESMLTWDGRAGLIAGGTLGMGAHLYTFEPSTVCDDATALRPNGGNTCYEVKDYPHETSYSPPATVGICLHGGSTTSSIGHAKSGFGTEVLPLSGEFPAGCLHTASALDSWLGRDAGPLGRAVARAYDYLRPRTLFADDAGVGGFLRDFSPVGGFFNSIFSEDFNDAIANGPDVGDSLVAVATTPGYIQLASGLGNLTDSVVVLSQAQGNCANCPVFSLLGTRANATVNDTVGTYEVTWQSLQNKPNIKEAPFFVINAAGDTIAKLAYSTESNVNNLRFNGAIVGSWTQNVAQTFTITVNLTMLDPTKSNRIALSINGTEVVPLTPSANARTLRKIGYVLTGIDAGIIASDNWKITRKSDSP